MRWLDSITDSIGMNLSKLWEIMKDRGGRHAAAMGSERVRHYLVTEQQQQCNHLQRLFSKKGCIHRCWGLGLGPVFVGSLMQHWRDFEETSHIQGQRINPKKTVGGAKSCLESNLIAPEMLRGLKQTLCMPGSRHPTETGTELCLGVS